jgi:hypothetical protein
MQVCDAGKGIRMGEDALDVSSLKILIAFRTQR